MQMWRFFNELPIYEATLRRRTFPLLPSGILLGFPLDIRFNWNATTERVIYKMFSLHMMVLFYEMNGKYPIEREIFTNSLRCQFHSVWKKKSIVFLFKS